MQNHKDSTGYSHRTKTKALVLMELMVLMVLMVAKDVSKQ